MSSQQQPGDPLAHLPPGLEPVITPLEQPPARPPSKMVETLVPFKNSTALTAYYCSILALIPGLGLVLGPVAHVMGVAGLCQATQDPSIRGGYHAMFSIALGLVLTIVNWTMLMILIVGYLVFVPPE